MSKVRWRFQFGMGSLILLMTVACVGMWIWCLGVEVLVATEDLDFKTEITETNVEFQRWPKWSVPPGAITRDDGIPIGYTLARIRRGHAVIAVDVALNEVPHVSIPRGYRVINVKVSFTTVSTSSIRPGDRVDAIAITENEDGESKKIICSDVRVFNIGHSTSESGLTGIFGLLVTGEQAAAIVAARKAGEVRLGIPVGR